MGDDSAARLADDISRLQHDLDLMGISLLAFGVIALCLFVVVIVQLSRHV